MKPPFVMVTKQAIFSFLNEKFMCDLQCVHCKLKISCGHEFLFVDHMAYFLYYAFMLFLPLAENAFRSSKAI